MSAAQTNVPSNDDPPATSGPDEQEPAAGQEVMQAESAEPQLSAEQVAQLREILITANPAAVPELIAGATFAELLASVAGAQAAFTRIQEAAMQGVAAAVPRGGSTRTVDAALFAQLSPEGKIAQGLQRR